MAEVNVKFNITADQIEKITDYLKYQTEIPEITETGDPTEQMIPNPETRKVFLYGKVKDYLRSCYKAQASKDGEVARVSALEQAETDLENLDVSE